MKRTLDLLDEPADIVQREPWLEITEIAGGYSEGLPPGGDAPAGQPATQRLVDDLAEEPAGAARFRLELGRDIVVQSERRSHVLMLGWDIMMSIQVTSPGEPDSGRADGFRGD